MKKLIKAGVLFGLMFLMAGSAWALPIAAGDQITMSVTWTNPYPYTPYIMTNNDTSNTAAWDKYFSFCIESTGLFTPGVTYEVASVENTVSLETKWLYASYLDGIYTDATYVQKAIWWLEGDQSGGSQWVWNNKFADDFAAADVTTFLAGWDIQAVNFLNGQNQVVGSNNPVPEPATMVLFGIGLLSIAGAGRKKIKA